MKILITSLLALLISSKVNAQGLDENMRNVPDCWKSGEWGDGLDPEPMVYHEIPYMPSWVRRGAVDWRNSLCKELYAGPYDTSGLHQDCITKWDGHCHDMKLWGFHHAHRRNECREKYEAICNALYASY